VAKSYNKNKKKASFNKKKSIGCDCSLIGEPANALAVGLLP